MVRLGLSDKHSTRVDCIFMQGNKLRVIFQISTFATKKLAVSKLNRQFRSNLWKILKLAVSRG